MKRFYMTIFSLGIILMLSGGCKTPGEMEEEIEKPEYVISVHEIIDYPRGKSKMEIQIESLSGRTIWVNQNHFLHSREIQEIKRVEMPSKKGFYDLYLKLDRVGLKRWMILCGHFKGRRVALVIDGTLYRTFVPEQVIREDDEWVLLRGPIDVITAKEVESKAKSNYEHFNKDKGIKWFN